MKKFEIFSLMAIIMFLAIVGNVSALSFADYPSLSDNITAYWNFDDLIGDKFYDQVGVRDGVVVNQTGIVDWALAPDCKLTRCVYFNGSSLSGGTDGYINITQASNLFNTTRAFSISFWINETVSQSNNDWMGSVNSGTNTQNPMINIYRKNTGAIRTGSVIIKDSNGDYLQNTEDVASSIGSWSHYVYTFNGTNSTASIKIYRNGVASTLTADSEALKESSTIEKFFIGSGGGFYGTTGYFDEVGVWSRELNSTEASELYNSGNGLTYNGTGVTLNSPLNNFDTINSSILFNATIIPSTGKTQSNATLYVWFTNGSLFNSTTNYLTGTSPNTTTWLVNNFPKNNYSWNVLGCDSGNLCRYATSNKTFFVSNIIINSETYNSSTHETASETFILNATLASSFISSTFNYAGTSYSVTPTISGGNYIFTKTIDVPTGATNNTFNWAISTSGGNNNSTTHNQSVGLAIFTLCNSTYPTPFVNLTFIDETSLTNINATIDGLTWLYWLGSGSVNKTLIYQNTTANLNYAFCFNTNRTLNNIGQFQYSSIGYPQRARVSSNPLSNATTNIVSYLLASNLGVLSSYATQTQIGQPVSGVTVLVERQFSGIWTIINQGLSDNSGLTSFFLNFNFPHRLTFSKTGYTTQQFTIVPTQSIYTVVMPTANVSGPTQNSSLQGLSWQLGIIPNVVFITKNTNYTFWVNLTANFSNLVGCQLDLLDNSSSVLATTSGINSSSVCNLAINYNVNTQPNIRMRTMVNIGNGYFVIDADKFFAELSLDIPPRGTISSFISNIQSLTIFGDTDRAALSKIILFFFLLVIVLAFISFQTNWDFATTGGILLLLFPVVLIASIMGFFSINYLSATTAFGGANSGIAQWLQKYTVALIAGFITGGFMLNKWATDQMK